ncbi:7 transmembrane receptor (rhodopsin family) domain-containing protein [Ditylenchus destructor]|uniref:7 transmembrane receptor (Rhodopsin family) domain-containing protein n=1 Tax=Ditylenchus destructor TaxID=166010 RepID=A0AAD4RAS7_9BILA|nr:7 transmembrane receptor (rhodopsin family) domain-containing protein [Ditylenchus destructor]
MNQSSAGSSDYGYDLPVPMVVLLAIPATIIILMTVFGNLLVLCFKARVGRSNTTLLVWNLGLTDFLVGIIVLPLGAIHLLHRKWIFGRAMCRIWVAADVTFCTCSVVTICTISIDRYLAVTRPLKYKSVITKFKVVLAIILIWLFSSTILLATVRWDAWEWENMAETALRVHFGKNNGMVEHQRRVLRTHERIAKTLGVVSCSFLFCWLPFFTIYLANFKCHGCLPTVAIDLASWLGYCNSMLNPIIYSFTVKEFKRSALRAILPVWKIFYGCCPNLLAKPPDKRVLRMTRNLAGKTNRKHPDRMAPKTGRTSNVCKASREGIKRRSTTPVPHNASKHNALTRIQASERRRRVPLDLMLEDRRIFDSDDEEFVHYSLTSSLAKSNSALKTATIEQNNNKTAECTAPNNSSSRSTETLSSSTDDLIRMPCRYSLKRHSSPATIMRRTSTISNFIAAKRRKMERQKLEKQNPNTAHNSVRQKSTSIAQKAAQARAWFLSNRFRSTDRSENKENDTRCQTEEFEKESTANIRGMTFERKPSNQSTDVHLTKEIRHEKSGTNSTMLIKKTKNANGPASTSDSRSVKIHECKSQNKEKCQWKPNMKQSSTQCSLRVYCTTNVTDL